METSALVSYADLEVAFLWVCAGPPTQNTAYVCRTTGKTHWASDLVDSEEPLPDDIDDSSVYVAVPHKVDLNLGKNLALKFTDEHLPDSYDVVFDFFRRRGAYARFKDLLDRKDCLDAWYEYEARAVENALREWSAQNGITLEG